MAGGPKVVILATFCRFFHFPRGSIGNLSFSSRIPRHFFQKFMENDPFFGGGSPFGGGYPLIGGGVPPLGGSKSVSSGIGREFRALSVAHLCMFGLCYLRNAIAIVTHKILVRSHQKVALGCHNPAWDPLKRGPPPYI